jgi:RNA polymerase sigma factor (TIGR02999 family)
MNDVTQILARAGSGDPAAARELLPLVYDELRKLASARMAHERPDHTLSATALVHEAYLRLVGSPQGASWESRGHFFAAAAEAMRRILVESARRRQSAKRGGRLKRVELRESNSPFAIPADELLSVDEAIGKLARDEPLAAELVKLRYFVGLPLAEAAEALGVSRATASRYWAYAKAFLVCELEDQAEDFSSSV